MGDDLNMKVTGSDTTHFNVEDVTGESVTISYHTLVGNNPSKNGNYIAIWQGDGLEIPWGQEPMWSGQIDSSERDGSYFKDGLNLTNLSYVVGYSVVPEGEGRDNFCAVALVPPGGNFRQADNSMGDSAGDGQMASEHIAYIERLREEEECFEPYISLESLQSTVARIGYHMPSGYDPEEKMNWIGLWEQKPNMYEKEPIYAVRVASDGDEGSVSLRWNFKRNTSYTLGYFASGWNENEKKGKQNGLVCSLTFRT